MRINTKVEIDALDFSTKIEITLDFNSFQPEKVIG